jgi:hypothetical protein
MPLGMYAMLNQTPGLTEYTSARFSTARHGTGGGDDDDGEESLLLEVVTGLDDVRWRRMKRRFTANAAAKTERDAGSVTVETMVGTYTQPSMKSFEVVKETVGESILKSSEKRGLDASDNPGERP